MIDPLLGGLAPARFLARCWQKRPLLVRQALPDWRDPLTPAELAGLACEGGVESRLVLERGGERPWQVVHGPQDARRLRRLPATHWTLLVQECNRHVPALEDLLERFSFIPRWRLDDVMVSFAPRFGGVGPHIDGYDVFLIQGRGRRRWRIATRCDPALRPGLDLRVLRRFRCEREWVLEPGDMLYLPPGVAHHGVALEDCLTYSIGFRAPSQADLVLGLARSTAEAADRALLYADPDLTPQRSPGEIARPALRRLSRLLAAAVRVAAANGGVEELVGRVVTEPKFEPSALARPVTASAVALRVRRGATLARRPGGRAAFIRRRERETWLFVDGVRHPLSRGLAGSAPLLCGPRRIPQAELVKGLRTPGFAALVAALVSAGSFVLGRARRARAAPAGRRRNRRVAGTRSRAERR